MPAILLILLVYLTTSNCDGFRIKRSGLAGFEDPYALSNAYSGIERRRRRTDYGPLLLEDDGSYFNPNSDEDDGEGYLIGLPYLDEAENIPGYFPEYRLKPEISTYRGLQEYPVSYGNPDKPVVSPQKRMSHKSYAYKRMGKQSISELQKIFASAEVPEKRLAPVKRQETAISRSINNDQESKASQTQDLVQKVREILAAAEKITRAQEEKEEVGEKESEPELIKDVVVEKISPEGDIEEKEERVTVENENGITAEQIKDERVTNEVTENVNDSPLDEGMVDNSEGEDRMQTKSKRASSKCDDESYVSDLEDEVVRLRNEVIRLQMLLMLQDKENDYLANALKYATLDQLEDDDRLATKEYDDISKATETEELIQQIAEETGPDAENNIGEYLQTQNEYQGNEEIKRSDPISDKDGWIDPPVQEGISFANDQDNQIESGIANEQGSEFPIQVPYPDDDIDDEEEEDEENEAMDEVAEAVNEEIEKETENAEKKEAIKELLEGFDKAEIEGLIEHLQEINDQREEEVEDGQEALSGVCLPVLELSQNCAFADTLGIPIDDEARNLCSRHQMCYTCGSAHGISRTGCNDGYKGTVIDTCKDDNSCIRQSAIFLRLMEKYHKYEPESPDECGDVCVEDFILDGGLVV